MTDARKEALKFGLRQLRAGELQRLLDHMDGGGRVLLDRDSHGCANYSIEEACYCPLAIAVGIEDRLGVRFPHDHTVYEILTQECHLRVYNTRGVPGEFYTTNRRADLLETAREVLYEKLNP